MWIYYPIAPSIGPATSRLHALKGHGRALESTSRLVCATPSMNVC